MKQYIGYVIVFFAGAYCSALVIYSDKKETVDNRITTAEVMTPQKNLAPHEAANLPINSNKTPVIDKVQSNRLPITKGEVVARIEDIPAQKIAPELNVLPPVEDLQNKNSDIYYSYDNSHYKIDERQQLMDNTLDNEVYDQSWAEEKLQNVHQLMDGAAINNVVFMGAECKTTLCKLEVNVADKNAEKALLQYAAQNPQFVLNDSTGTIFQSPDGNGGSNISYYWSREGYQLP